MNKLALLSLVFISATTLAALPGTPDPTEVNVPQSKGGFFFGVEGDYVQWAHSNGLGNYAIIGSNVNFSSRVKSVDPEYDWGWGADVGYTFPGTGNDVDLSYFQFDNDEHNFSLALPTFFITPEHFVPTFLFPGVPGLISFAGSSVIITSADVKQDFDFDKVDLTAGQWINIGCRGRIHPKVGIRYAEVEYKLTTNYLGNGFLSVVSTPILGVTGSTIFPIGLSSEDESDYNGVGPLVGMDGTYYLGYGIGIIGHMDGALLVGDARGKLNAIVSWPTVTFALPVPAEDPIPTTLFGVTAANAAETDSTIRIVPALDIKLGLDYTYIFNDWLFTCSDESLTIEAGWQFAHYFNAIDKLSVLGTGSFATDMVTDLGFPSSSFTFHNLTHKTADFGYQGPYASVTLHI